MKNSCLICNVGRTAVYLPKLFHVFAWLLLAARIASADPNEPELDPFYDKKNFGEEFALNQKEFEKGMLDLTLVAGKDRFGVIARDDLWCTDRRAKHGAFKRDGLCNIPVCWKTPGYKNEKLATQNAVGDAWEGHGAVRFEWYENCPAKFLGIMIAVNDVRPHTRGLGVRLGNPKVHKQYGQSMVLNFELSRWEIAKSVSREIAIRNIAIHEFGHALGFAHEHQRLQQYFDSSDNPYVICEKKNFWGMVQQLKQEVKGTQISPDEAKLVLSKYDPVSVMNYCGNITRVDFKPSKLDIETLKLAYPGYK